MDIITAVFTDWSKMAGVAIAIAFLIDLGKRVGIVKDGQSNVYSAILNALGIGVMLALKLAYKDVDWALVDSTAGNVTQVAVIVVGFLFQLLASYATHDKMRGLPILGQSFTKQ